MADETPDVQNPNPQEPVEVRRRPTMKMASLAMQHMMNASQNENARASKKDMLSELMLPLSSLMLILAICFSGNPAIKAISFAFPLAALFYYLYRRIGAVAHLEVRQAYITWRLLIATFLFGGTFALFCFFVITYLTEVALNRIS